MRSWLWNYDYMRIQHALRGRCRQYAEVLNCKAPQERTSIKMVCIHQKISDDLREMRSFASDVKNMIIAEAEVQLC
jgi:hypothetical protein